MCVQLSPAVRVLLQLSLVLSDEFHKKKTTFSFIRNNFFASFRKRERKKGRWKTNDLDLFSFLRSPRNHKHYRMTQSSHFHHSINKELLQLDRTSLYLVIRAMFDVIIDEKKSTPILIVDRSKRTTLAWSLFSTPSAEKQIVESVKWMVVHQREDDTITWEWRLRGICWSIDVWERFHHSVTLV